MHSTGYDDALLLLGLFIIALEISDYQLGTIVASKGITQTLTLKPLLLLRIFFKTI